MAPLSSQEETSSWYQIKCSINGWRVGTWYPTLHVIVILSWCHVVKRESSDILPLSYFLEFVLRGLVLIMGSPGCIKTVKYVFYVNVRRPDKLVLIKFVVNNLRNCRKQPTKKINHRNINTENCSKFSQNYMLIFCENVKNNMTLSFIF